MTLIKIDKTLYRKHLKVVFTSVALALMAISVASSTVFIYLLSTPDVSHFLHNIAGVVFAAIIVFIVLNKIRRHPYMVEVLYVWDLKQHLNRIQRKAHKIEAAVVSNNNDAMIIMNFMYRGSKQLYELDDNTITMDNLLSKINALDLRMQKAGLNVSTDDYEPVMLKQF